MRTFLLALSIAAMSLLAACGGGDVDESDAATLDELEAACQQAQYDYSANGKKGTPPEPCRPTAA